MFTFIFLRDDARAVCVGAEALEVPKPLLTVPERKTESEEMALRCRQERGQLGGVKLRPEQLKQLQCGHEFVL